jgi:phosphate transport system substrate-binding protein
MKHHNSSIAALAIVLATGATTFTATAQTAVDNFPMPKTVAAGTKVQIDGSNSMQAVNQGLREKFQQQFPGTDIALPAQYKGSDAGVKAVAEGKADLASIGRLLTTAETAQGIAEKAIGRSKIAIIVKANNPYTGNLTLQDFAKIYRGEITDWSQLPSAKGAKGKIKVIDRPNTSDTRRAFANYPVFQNGKLKTGKNAQQLTEDSTKAVVDKLGQDGIGYAPADQVKNITGIRTVTLHNTQPNNPKYPFSQPLVYAYKTKDGKVAAGAKAFLGYASDPTGQKAVTESITAGIAANSSTGSTNPATTPSIAPASPNATTTTGDSPATATTAATSSGIKVKDNFPWWAVPFLAVGGVLLWIFRKKPTRTVNTYAAGTSAFVPTAKSIIGGATPPPFPVENLSPGLRQVWLAVKNEPTSFDSIFAQSQRSAADTTDALSALESMGLITQLPGRKYQRIVTSSSR